MTTTKRRMMFLRRGLFILLALAVAIGLGFGVTQLLLSRHHAVPPPMSANTSSPAAPDATETLATNPVPQPDADHAVAPHQPSVTPADTLSAEGWRQHAIAMPSFRYRDKFIIALIFDDVGMNARHTQGLIDIKAPITLSFLPYAPNVQRQVRAARAAGHEVMLHLPMEALDVDAHPGPNALMLDLTAAEIADALKLNLDSFTGYIGINNHMGSKFTQDRAAMKIVLDEIKQRDLIFVDSLTSADSIAGRMAASMDILSGTRDVFLDNTDTPEAIMTEFARLEGLARKHGTAIAIGHPRANTLVALRQWLVKVENSEFMVVPLSVVLQERRKAADKKQD